MSKAFIEHLSIGSRKREYIDLFVDRFSDLQTGLAAEHAIEVGYVNVLGLDKLVETIISTSHALNKIATSRRFRNEPKWQTFDRSPEFHVRMATFLEEMKWHDDIILDVK